MVLIKAINLSVVSVLILLNACSSQIKSGTASGSANASSASLMNTPFKPTDGIIYFSYDNGLTWKDKSQGLPATIIIGLGGIAVSESQLALFSKTSGLYFFDMQEDRWVSTPVNRLLLDSNPGALILYKGGAYVGTRAGGVFYSSDKGISVTVGQPL